MYVRVNKKISDGYGRTVKKGEIFKVVRKSEDGLFYTLINEYGKLSYVKINYCDEINKGE